MIKRRFFGPKRSRHDRHGETVGRQTSIKEKIKKQEKEDKEDKEKEKKDKN